VRIASLPGRPEAGNSIVMRFIIAESDTEISSCYRSRCLTICPAVSETAPLSLNLVRNFLNTVRHFQHVTATRDKPQNKQAEKLGSLRKLRHLGSYRARSCRRLRRFCVLLR